MPRHATEYDHDVLVVGGGPAGCSAGVFTSRYGLDTVLFDRGRSSIKRCAFLENFPGFPGGVDIETLYGLLHDHAEAAGCSIVDDHVESVERAVDGDGFVVTPADGSQRTARRVVAATRYGGEYLRPLDGDAMFHVRGHGGEERFDKSYADSDGTTPVDGLFIASPYGETGYQATMAAGRGARVGITLVEHVRRERGYPDPLANYYDWRRREASLDDGDLESWREWFHDRLPDDHGLDDDRLADLCERDLSRRRETYLSEDEVDRRTERAHDRLLDHVDDDRILAAARDIEADRRSSE
ncbi:NAD(P)/FAD-dependent oxidoreductase [Haloplanus halobius]|uniref:NAD(P)/FAD-dependent oxidoreductase n=1 Tax=Haloplanus halobius TaxID=2934938 RepID=UPI00200DF1D2|nr:NAD(P)/FAD-dependent oxidoreductase [Haloplanus sp. XH21]